MYIVNNTIIADEGLSPKVAETIKTWLAAQDISPAAIYNIVHPVQEGKAVCLQFSFSSLSQAAAFVNTQTEELKQKLFSLYSYSVVTVSSVLQPAEL